MSNFPIHHGITLAPNAFIENLQLEILTSDPIPASAGRIWFNSTEKSVKYSTLSSTGEVITVSNIVSSDVATALQSAKDYTDTSISALVDSAPEILNTLKELSDAIAGDDNFSATVLTNIANAKAEILGEVGAAFDTLGEIETKLTQLDAADTVPGSVDFKVKAEQDRAEAAELGLSGRLSVFEGTGAGSVTALLADEVAARELAASEEQAARVAAELDLSNQIAANELARTDAAAAVEVARVAEAAAIEAARVLEAAAIESARVAEAAAIEAARVGFADAVEAARVAEAAAVESTRAGLAAAVEAARVAEAAFREQVLGSELNELWDSVDSNLSATEAAAATEHAERVAAELGLTNAIATNEATRLSDAATEQAARVAAEQGLTNAIATNEATRLSDAATEQAARVAAEQGLDTRVTTVEGQVNGKIGTLSGLTTDDKSTIVAAINEVDTQRNQTASNLVTEAATARANESTLQGNIDAEASTRASQDAAETLARTTAAGIEHAERVAAELGLSNRINTEVSDRQAAITDEALARTNADTAIRAAINASKYFHQTATTAVEHTIVHNLGSLQTSFVVLVERADGKYRNDIVSVEEVDSNTLKVYLSEARKIKISVNRYEAV
jgi:hypothetical protein